MVEALDLWGERHRTHVFPGIVPTLFSEARADKSIHIVVFPAPGPSLQAPLVLAVCETLLVIGVASALGMLPMMAMGAIMVFHGAASGAGMIFDEVAEVSRRMTRASKGGRFEDLMRGAPAQHARQSNVGDAHVEPCERRGLDGLMVRAVHVDGQTEGRHDARAEPPSTSFAPDHPADREDV